MGLTCKSLPKGAPRRLITLDVWETIRLRCIRDGDPMKTVARDLGLSKNTVRKYVRSLQAPDYQSPKRGVPARRVLLSHRRFDASIAEDNSSSHRRTTARRRRSEPTNQRTVVTRICREPSTRDPRQRGVRARSLCAGRSDAVRFHAGRPDCRRVLTKVHLFVAWLSYSGRHRDGEAPALVRRTRFKYD